MKQLQRHSIARTIALLLALGLSALSAQAEVAADADLGRSQDPWLQNQLNAVINSLGLDEMVDRADLAVSLVVMEDGDDAYRLAQLNGHYMLYAASLPKIAILFAVMVASQEGTLIIDPAFEKDLHKMIRVSCNACATRAMERVGREQLLEILQRPEYEFYDENNNGGLWVGKDYAGAAAHQRDPINGLSHGATTFQVARFYYRLAMGNLVDEKHSQLMLEMMSNPGISHKFVKALENLENFRIWRKSGSWGEFHADSALVEFEGHRYIMVALVHDAGGEQILRKLGRALHAVVAQTWAAG
jgi:beta-lactamase class A